MHAEAARRRDLALIHMAKKDLNLSQDEYTAVLQATSAGDLNAQQRAQALANFKRLGFKPQARKKGTGAAPTKGPGTRPMAPDAQSAKMRKLWLELHALGAVRNSAESALASYVKRQTGVDALQWLDSAQASAVIEALKKWLRRAERDSRRQAATVAADQEQT